MKILIYLLYILLILFPLGVLLRFEIMPTIYIYPSDIVVFLISVWFMVLVLKQKKSFFKINFFLPVYLFISACVLSLLANVFSYSFMDFSVGALYLIRFTLYSNLLFVGYLLKDDEKIRILYVLLGMGFIFGLLGVLQYVFFPDLRGLEYLGWDEHYYRIFSTFFDPNYSGALYVLILILGFGVFNFYLPSFYKKLIPFFLFLMLAGLFLTYSRNSYIMFVIAFAAYFILMKQKKLIFVLLFIITIGISIIPKHIHSEGVDLLRTASINSRINSMKTALMIFGKSPIFGTGFNTYRYAQEKYRSIDIYSRATHAGGGVSNSFLFVLATTGLIGFIAYINMWLQIFKRLFSYYSFNKNLFGIAIASIIGLFVHSLFENSLFFTFIMIWIYLLIGVVANLKKHNV